MKTLLIVLLTVFSTSFNTPDEPYQNLYVNFSTDPIIEGDVLINDVDNPYTLDYIKSKITIIDTEDGDITHLMYVIRDDYSEHMNDLGDYIIIFGVTDSNNSEVTFVIIVKNVDRNLPVIEVEVESTLKIPQYSLLALNLPRVIAYDQHDGDLTSSLVIQGLSSIDTDILGVHELTYTVSDSSGNTTTEVFTVEVVDSTAPEIDGVDTIVKRANVILDSNFYLAYFSASDDHDGIITNRIDVVKDDYLGNANVPGIYEVTVTVSDIQGNYTNHTFTIQVVRDMIPNLIVDNYYWVIPNNHLFTDSDFIETLKFIGDLPNYEYIFTTTYDNYTNQYERLGTYSKTFELLSSRGNEYEKDLILEVVVSDHNIVEESPSFIQENWKIMVGSAIVLGLVVLFFVGLKK